MLKLIRTDVYRILHNKSFYLTLLGMVAMVVTIVYSQTMVVSGLFDETMQKAIESTPLWGMSEVIMTCTMGLSVFSWFCIPIYAIVVGQEFSQGTYKNVFFSGVSRKDFVIGKLIVIASFVTVLLLVLFGSAALLGYLHGGMGSLNITTDMVRNLIVSGIFFVIIITVYYAIAMCLQVLSNSIIMAIVSVLVFPFIIQIFQMNLGWQVLNAISFATTTFESMMGLLTSAEILQTIGMNLIVLVLTASLTIFTISRKEF